MRSFQRYPSNYIRRRRNKKPGIYDERCSPAPRENPFTGEKIWLVFLSSFLSSFLSPFQGEVTNPKSFILLFENGCISSSGVIMWSVSRLSFNLQASTNKKESANSYS
mmetsp:Transcript_19209/g.49207  ORF Transcript_19209/g.49207 Transcript_19209/m.49207 type:complete len:108 (+) Transcript_19209:1476-1799(+)